MQSLCDAVIAKNVSLQRFRLHLLGLSAFENNYDGEQPIILDDVKTDIKKAGSIYEIFEILTTECCSFINVGIFQSIMDRYRIDAGCYKDLQYSKHLEAYLKQHKISEFVLINPKLDRFPENSEVLTLKFNVALSSNITKVLDLKSAIADILGIDTNVLRLVGIEEGCVIVTFLLPAAVASSLFANGLTAEQEADIRALPVLWLTCGDYKLKDQNLNAAFPDIPAEQCKHVVDLLCCHLDFSCSHC